MTRVQMVVPEMGSGGAEALVDQAVRHLLAQGHEVGVASAGGWRADALAGTGARLTPLPLRGRSPLDLLTATGRLVRLLRRTPPDVLHAHNVKAAALTHVARRLARCPVPLVVSAHGFAPESYDDAARVLDRAADVVVAVSDDVADRLRESGLRRPRLLVVENAVTAPVAPDRATARSALGLADDAAVVVCLARMTEQKRHDLLIEAFLARADDVLLLLAGSGPTRERLERQAAPAGDRIRFLGDRDDAPRLMAAADVLVLPSDWEGLPVTVLEAMGVGLPVVASAVGGVATLGDAVELVPPGSAAALDAAIDRVIGDAGRRSALVAEGARTMRERFDAGRMLAAYDGVYADLIGQSPASPREGGPY